MIMWFSLRQLRDNLWNYCGASSCAFIGLAEVHEIKTFIKKESAKANIGEGWWMQQPGRSPLSPGAATPILCTCCLWKAVCLEILLAGGLWPLLRHSTLCSFGKRAAIQGVCHVARDPLMRMGGVAARVGAADTKSPWGGLWLHGGQYPWQA